jgi:hypothetical protein
MAVMGVLAVVTLVVAKLAALTLAPIPAAFARDQISRVVAHVLVGTEVSVH